MDLSCSEMKQALAEKERLLSLKEERPTALLEREWAWYKYLILAKNPNGYKEIRVLLKNKSAFPTEEFYGIVEKSLLLPENKGYEINAAQHVFGYF